MAEYYEAQEVSERLKNQLEVFKWESIDNGLKFRIELPMHLYFNYQRLVLYVYPIDDGYYVSDDGDTFLEHTHDTKYYYDLFINNDKNRHYNIKLKKNYICKKYNFNFSLIAAIDEFIKFFVYLDAFMEVNSIV